MTPTNNVLRTLARVLKNGRPFMAAYGLIGAVGLAVMPLEFAVLGLSRRLVDTGFLLQNWAAIRRALVALAALFILRSLLTYGVKLFAVRLHLRVNQTFQDRLCGHLLRLPMAVLGDQSTGRIMSRLLDDGARFTAVLEQIFGRAVLDPLKALFLLALLSFFNWRLCLVMAVLAATAVAVMHWVGNRLHGLSKEMQEKDAALFGYVEQIFYNVELVKSKAVEGACAARFHRRLDELIRLSLSAEKIQLLAQPALQLMRYSGLGAVVAYGSWMIAAGELSVGTLTLFLGATYLFFNTLGSAAATYTALRENLARMEILYELLDTAPESVPENGTVVKPASIAALAFERVSFAYGPGPPVLKDVSVVIPRGGLFGITGQSGSGKTTLIRLLVRFYEPDRGLLRVNGRPIRELPLAALRSAVGIVFQHNLILNDTIRNNIAFGHPDLTEARLHEAAGLAEADAFIRRLPHGYDTVVGESGRRLSGGQRQRLAIARALAADPDVLVLDEGTSFLEVEEEARILANIRTARRSRINILVSHRPSVVNSADRLLVLDNGRVLAPVSAPPICAAGEG